ncbi:MAG: DUF2852 domain-containing protein [Pseudobdellovibrionaceae bacterium]
MEIFILTVALLFAIPNFSSASESSSTKEQIQKDFEKGYEDLKVQIKELQEKAKTSSGNAKKEMETQLAKLDQEQKEFQTQMQKLKKSSGKAWDDVKTGTGDAYESLKKSVIQAKQRFQSEDKK